MKIAVVGSGISGLASAHYLSREHEVHLFEAGDRLGGHTHTVDVDTPSGRYAVDTGFIVFNDRTYPNFIRLMNGLGVASQESSMSFSVKTEGGLEYNGTDLNGLFAQRSNLLNPYFLQMIADILRFNREAPKLLNDPDNDIPLAEYLIEGNYSKAFINHYIVPMGSAIWSASAAQMQRFPAAYFVRFFHNHGMLSVNDRPVWRVLRGGSRSYIPALTEPFKSRIHSHSPAVKVKRRADKVSLSINGPSGLAEIDFDHVVLASHGDESLKLLDDATTDERAVLGAFSYQENKTVLHTDTSVLPERRRAWASWNYFVPKVEKNTVAVTYNMNILQSLRAPETFLVSLNMDDRIDPAKVVRRLVYHHPVYTSHAVAAQGQWDRVSGKNRTHFCGAYWGFGFHEDGVKSALRVCETFGVKP